MDARTRILTAAAELLTRAPDADVATRDVCQAAGVAPSALYRQFGDKEGLLAAAVDFGFERYLAAKRKMQPSDDPVQDLRDGWDNHVRFALDNPSLYRLLWSPALSAPPAAVEQSHRLLREVVERIAAAGRLGVPVDLAVRMVMSANAGVALSLVVRPGVYADDDFSAHVRDAVVAAITVAPGPHAAPDGVAAAANALAVKLRASPPARFTGAESALLQQWLGELTTRP